MLLCCCRYHRLYRLVHLLSISDFIRCKDRLCFSAVFEMNPEAKVLSSYFAKAWMIVGFTFHVVFIFGASKTNAKNVAREWFDLVQRCPTRRWNSKPWKPISSSALFVAFFQAQERLDAQSDDEIGQALQHLAALARKLRAQRFEVGVLEVFGVLRCRRWFSLRSLTICEDGAIELEGGELKFEPTTRYLENVLEIWIFRLSPEVGHKHTTSSKCLQVWDTVHQQSHWGRVE